MNLLTLTLISTLLMGLGATLTFDLWGLFLKIYRSDRAVFVGEMHTAVQRVTTAGRRCAIL
jgi:hypothetical protein